MKAEIENTVKTIINAFKERPGNFLTESDLHAYTYLTFYRQKKFANYKLKFSLVHINYPTITNVKNERGAFDVAILPAAYGCKKIIELLEKKKYNELIKFTKKNPLLAAIEFKFIRDNNKKWVERVEYDLKKLQNQHYILNRYILVFDNRKLKKVNFASKIKELSEKYRDVKIKYISRTKKWSI